MADDILKSIKANLYERTVSPLSGAIALSWAAWNYRLLFTLFSSMPLREKFQYIDTQLYSADYWWVPLIAGPIVTALLFLFAYPTPAKWVYEFSSVQQRKLKAIRQRIEDETPLTVQESRQIRKNLVTLQADYENQLRRAHEETTRLRQVLAGETEKTEKLQVDLLNATNRYEQATSKRKVLSDEQLTLLLMTQKFRLFFNPTKDMAGSKIMTFGPDGEIKEGQNRNEHRWRIDNGHLELLQPDGKVHSRFEYSQPTGIFTHTGDPDTLSGHKNQYLAPVP